MDKDYIRRKIQNCRGLIASSTSDAQREIYKGYLLFWREELKFSSAIVKEIKEANDEVDVGSAQLFEAKFPPKKAYYKRDGKQQKTRGFIEFLKSLE